MKTLYTILLIFVLSIFAVTPSYAGDDEALYALGGFILGQAINGNHGNIDIGVYGGDRDSRYGIRYNNYPRYGYGRDYPNSHYRDYKGRPYDYCAPRGYWTTQRYQVWVPGRWIHGEGGRIWIEGYYKWVSERVWVETGRGRP